MSNTGGLEHCLVDAVCEWYEAERGRREFALGVANAGLIVLEHLRHVAPLDQAAVLAPSRGQVRGLNGTRVQKIVARYAGMARRMGTEAGRTSRGTPAAAIRLVDRINRCLSGREVSEAERMAAIDAAQGWIVRNVHEPFWQRDRLQPTIDLNRSPEYNVERIMAAARERGQAGAVAQHLVGAKLALRFRAAKVWNFSHSVADKPTDRPGDFVVGDTVFHVTIAPSANLFAKSRGNLKEHYRVVVLVPGDRLNAARQLADMEGIQEQVAIRSIEHFVGQNLDEMADFGRLQFSRRLRELLEEYNRRVGEAETDSSLLIEIPSNL